MVAVTERVKELKAKKEQKEKKLREKEEKKRQRREAERDMYKWLEEWSPIAPMGVTNNANNININAAAADAESVGQQLLQPASLTTGFQARRAPPPHRSQQ